MKEFDSFGDRGMIVSYLKLYATTALTKKLLCVTFDKQGAANILPKALGLSQGLLVATGETWKIGRHTLTPSFSGMKMKLVWKG